MVRSDFRSDQAEADLSRSFDKACVIGASSVGLGIAAEFASAGIKVSLVAQDGEVLSVTEKEITSVLVFLEEAGRFGIDRHETVMDRITFSTSITEGSRCADLIVESLVDDLDLKQKALVTASKAAKADAILSSNTSSFLPSVIAGVLNRPEHFAVAHYFAPPYLVPLVELVPGEKTASYVIDELENFYRAIGKEPVCLEKEILGSIGNRLQAAMMREALALVEDGYAEPKAIDAVVKNTIGRRLAVAGPFEIWEQIGWDLVETIAGELVKEISNDLVLSPGFREKIFKGDLGAKSGHGYYDWDGDSIREFDERVRQALVALSDGESAG